MIKALLNLARAFTGVWSELRKIRLLIEWLVMNHPAFDGIGLPPTKGQISAAEADQSIADNSVDEDIAALQRLRELAIRRANGEEIGPDEPGAQWKPW